MMRTLHNSDKPLCCTVVPGGHLSLNCLASKVGGSNYSGRVGWGGNRVKIGSF